MANFTTIQCDINTGSDASPVWTHVLAFGGSAGANELRWANSTAGATSSTASASWPFYVRPAAGTAAVNQMWGFTGDTTGFQITNYDGTNTNSLILRWDWDNVGTYASAPQFSFFGDSTHTAPSAGTQPGGQSGSPIVNGQSSDTSSTAYVKIQAYGQGVTAGGVQQTPGAGSLSTAVSATDGTAGSVTPGSAAWIATHWQSGQGFVQYILNGATPAATTAGFWYWALILYTGVNMSTASTILPVATYQYTYS